jgi:hypothetical protein
VMTDLVRHGVHPTGDTPPALVNEC